MVALPRLGKFVLALGIIGLIRLLPEIYETGRIQRIYALLVTVDAILGVATGVAGEGLMRGKPWAPKLAISTAGVVLSTSLGLGFLIVRFSDAERDLLSVDILSRLLYYVMAVAFWPYAVRALILAAPPGAWRPLMRSFIIWLVAGLPLLFVVLLILGR